MRFQAGIQAILIIISITIIFIVVRPEFDEIATKQDRLAELNDAINKADSYNRSLGEKLSKANSFPQSDLIALNKFMPNEIDASRVARDVTNIVEGSGMLLQDVTVGELAVVNVDGGGSEEAPGVVITGTNAMHNELRQNMMSQTFSVEAIGTYDNMKKMMEAFERNAYPLRVTGMSFASEEDASSVLFSFKIDLQTFALRATNQ